tara:strand:- start:5458 stop:5703 length:246 start_codon:yes stop_codon:yes gene_type:complete
MKLPIEKAAMKYKASLSTGEVLMTLREMVAREKEAGCEKLPNKAMQDNCEKKKKEGEENDDKADKKASVPTSVEGWIRWED